MKFNEDTRVKIPSILHLMRLGYTYLSIKNQTWDEDTNIFKDIFIESVGEINADKEVSEDDLNRLYDDTKILLDNEDLGKAFFERLTDQSGFKIIDFQNFDNNTFHVVTELTYKNGDEEFRPDIILLINGMPLAFIEVKKPNNKEGVIAERNRINTRFKNKKFRRFINLTQLMVFSNNMEYDSEQIEPIQGAFYATASYSEPQFNYFREEESLPLEKLLKILTDEDEHIVLKDNNYEVIKSNPEFLTNKDPDTPTNRLSTSLFSRERLAFMLQYAIVYVKAGNGIQKHIMRYPQIFATKAIAQALDKGTRKGIIWHTQGSGKTALAYYNVRHLTDYFQRQHIIPKFYFIVDRIDLAIQAHREFANRGLVVHTVNSRESFKKEISSNTALHNHSGKAEITVVNIQKFENDPDVVSTTDYNIGVQRIYFLDEVHRSYNPKGSFLANLTESDPNAIKIGLTGTPLLGEEYNSKMLFGDYIHTYYYNASIADGYTLRLIREEIESSYKLQLKEVLANLEIQKGTIEEKDVYSDERFVTPMLEYIVNDFDRSRVRMDDETIGAMVIAHSSDQAKMMFSILREHYPDQTAALILHDEGTKEERKDEVEEFKMGKIDFLFVYNMLLTGFDAPRLKKLYLGRVLKAHNLLQGLTRVNRTYRKHRYGYVVDFADISKEFDKTNKAYWDELQNELGDEIETYSKLFKSKEEIEAEIDEIKDTLWQFDTTNAEIFRQQIDHISDIKQMQQILKVLDNARSLYNIIRLTGNYELLEKIDFSKLLLLYRVARDHLDLLNLKLKMENASDTSNLLNEALEEVIFAFVKIGEEELILADQLKDTLRQTREALAGNFDPKDPVFISLKEELERLFKQKKLSEVTQEEMMQNIGSLDKIHEKIKELNRQNALLRAKYVGDAKYARIHKRLRERNDISESERKLFEALSLVKADADEKVWQNTSMLNNEDYFKRLMMTNIITRFHNEQNINLTPDATRYINGLVVTEYLNEFNGVSPW